jgi:hypothetical protein
MVFTNQNFDSTVFNIWAFSASGYLTGTTGKWTVKKIQKYFTGRGPVIREARDLFR